MSVIIPVFNGDALLHRCLDSVLAQTMQDFEVIVVNDGSTDGSLEILHEYAASYSNVRVLDQPNAGQGAARNRALGEAQGEFVLFVDADDFIERVTLQVTTERALEDDSDFVHFDWKLYDPGSNRPGDYHYYNTDPFWHRRVLVGAECDELLRVQNFYSVTKLYRRSFLNAHSIRFEEGRIYEDNPFVLQAVNRAQRASLVHSPLYTIDPRPDSSTRSHTDTDKHVRDHLHAVRRTFELLDRRNPRAAAYLAAYHIKKIGPYYERRIPRRFRGAYVEQFVQILHEANIDFSQPATLNGPTRLAARLSLFERQRSGLFRTMIVGKNLVMPRVKQTKRGARTLKRWFDSSSPWNKEINRALGQPIKPKTMTFLGFDSRYAGNSKYLFKEVLSDQRFAGWDIRFVTADEGVAARVRLDPGESATFEYIARSQIVVLESWAPERARKHADSTWIQLWHGTPIKKMLFDSHEPLIIRARNSHKIAKYADVQAWDYFVVDSKLAEKKFETAFLLEHRKVIRSGYPRVQFLLDHIEDRELRVELRMKLGLPPGDDRKVVLYAPTWRDVNYGKTANKRDGSYLLDLGRLAEDLGEDYVIAFSDHGYLSSEPNVDHERVIDGAEYEIQELILAADVVVTDYSSLSFDAQAVGKQIVFYVPDRASFDEIRGVYEDVWSVVSATGQMTDSPSEVAGLVAAVADAPLVAATPPRYRRGDSLINQLLSIPQHHRAAQTAAASSVQESPFVSKGETA